MFYRCISFLIKRIVVSSILVGYACINHAQSDTANHAFLQTELSFIAGRLVKIHGEYPPNDITTVTELNLSWKTLGRRHWQSIYNYPIVGFSITHAQFGNQDVLGQAVGFIPTMRFSKWKNETQWSIRAGLGVAHFFKPYNSIDNPRNLVIGSPWANMTLAKVEMSRPLAKKFRYHIGASFMHCSNAHVDVPNIGANLLAVHLGFSYSDKPEYLNKHRDKKSIYNPSSWKAGVQSILGIHEFKGTIRPVDGPKYFVYGASAFTSKSFNAKGKLTLGLNYHYYTAYHDYALSQELFGSDDDIKKKSQNLVLFAGYEWNYGHIALFVQGGINLYDPFLHELNKVWDLPKSSFINLYTANKMGYKVYAFSQNGNAEMKQRTMNPYLSMAVKTNGGTADFLEFGIGTEISFKKRKPISE